MKKFALPAAVLALLVAPIASHGAEHAAKANAKLAEATSVEGLALKSTLTESTMTYACAAGQAGGGDLAPARFKQGLGCAGRCRIGKSTECTAASLLCVW